MLARCALALALLLAVPTALAGPVRDAAAPGIAEAYAVPCGTYDPATENACTTAGVAIASAMGLDVSPSIGTVRGQVCTSPDSMACRQVDGHPIAGGAFDVCVVTPIPVVTAQLLWHAVNGGNFTYSYMGNAIAIPFGPGIDPTIRATTTAAFAGTPLEGESLCHDHWSTAQEIVLLV